MLTQPTPYPYVGSYALFIDRESAEHPPAELVRIQMRREGEIVISFPLRDGAAGNKRVAPADLIDPTPLSTAEQREFHELDRALAGKSLRTGKQKAEAARRDALKLRTIWAPIAARLMREAAATAERRRAA